MTVLQLITNVEAQDETLGTTRGWIVPAGTSPDADLQLEALDHVDIPATEDEAEWLQYLSAELAHAGYAMAGPIVQDYAIVTAAITRV